MLHNVDKRLYPGFVTTYDQNLQEFEKRSCTSITRATGKFGKGEGASTKAISPRRDKAQEGSK